VDLSGPENGSVTGPFNDLQKFRFHERWQIRWLVKILLNFQGELHSNFMFDGSSCCLYQTPNILNNNLAC
jgi:hypothetical protein